MPTSTAARGATASPNRGAMVPGRAVLVLVLVLSTLRMCRAVPEPGQHHSGQWVWGAAGQAQAEPLPLSRRKRDEGGQQPPTTITITTAMPRHGHTATMVPSSIETDSPVPDPLLGSVPPPAPGANASLHRALLVPTTAHVLEKTDSPDPDPLLGSVPPPAPSPKANLHQAPALPTTAHPLDETDSLASDPLLGSVPPPAPGTNTSLHRARVVPTTADPLDETDSPDPDLLSSVPAPAPGTNTSLHRARVVPTTADPLDETDSADPDLLSSVPAPAPSTQASPQTGITALPSLLTSPGQEGMVAGGRDSSSVTPPVLSPTTTAHREVNKTRASPVPTHSAPWDTKAGATAVPTPWDPSGLMGKCLLAILLLALVAATFMVCTGVLGTLLWRRARSAHRRLSPTEMVCISSLLPDGEVATNGPRPIPARRHRLLLDGGTEVDGDNLTLSSFLPEHS